MTSGRSTDYNDDIADELCMEIATGSSVAKACATCDVSEAVFYKWLTKHKEFVENYMRAREIRADHRFESSEQLMQDLRDEKITPNQARIMLDEIKWKTGKESAKKYGDKIAVGGADDLPPIKTRDMNDFYADLGKDDKAES